MTDRILELLVVLNHSARTRWCLYIGILFASVIQMLGRWLIDDFNLTGPVAPLTQVIRGALWDRYNAGSLAILGASIVTAARLYRLDRKRLFEL